MKRIMIFGLPGSGKSTFANELKKYLHLPLCHLDKHFFTKNWVEREYSEFLAIQKSFVDKESWIIEGNSMKSIEMRFSRADTAIYFKLPLWVCFWRLFKRRFQKNRQIEDRADGCSESLKGRLIKYLWNYKRRFDAEIQLLRIKYPHVAFHTFSTATQAKQFLKSVQNS